MPPYADGRFWWDLLQAAFTSLQHDAWEDFEKRVGLPREYLDGHGEGASSGSLRPMRQWILAEFQGRMPASLVREYEKLDIPLDDVSQRAMSLADLTVFANAESVDIAVHTVTHPVLPLLTPEHRTHEIASSFSTLRDAIPKTLPFLAYPYGLHDPDTWESVRAVGMQAAFTLGEGVVRRGMPPEILPRFNMSAGVGGIRFLLRMSGRLDGIVQSRRGLDGPFPALPSATT